MKPDAGCTRSSWPPWAQFSVVLLAAGIIFGAGAWQANVQSRVAALEASLAELKGQVLILNRIIDTTASAGLQNTQVTGRNTADVSALIRADMPGRLDRIEERLERIEKALAGRAQ